MYAVRSSRRIWSNANSTWDRVNLRRGKIPAPSTISRVQARVHASVRKEEVQKVQHEKLRTRCAWFPESNGVRDDHRYRKTVIFTLLYYMLYHYTINYHYYSSSITFSRRQWRHVRVQQSRSAQFADSRRHIYERERSFRVPERNSANRSARRRKAIASASLAWSRRCRTKGIRAKQRRGRPRGAPVPSLRASTLLPRAQRTVASGNSDSVNLPGALHFREGVTYVSSDGPRAQPTWKPNNRRSRGSYTRGRRIVEPRRGQPGSADEWRVLWERAFPLASVT